MAKLATFASIKKIAEKRHGGAKALEALMPNVKSPRTLSKISDDRWLSAMTKGVFQAGFNWSVIEKKWDGFEEAFEGFNPNRWAHMMDEDLDRLLKDTRIVRNAQKINSVPVNAQMILSLAAEHGSAANAFANWPNEDFIGLLDYVKANGGRLGGATAQYLFRSMGKDSFLISRDVTAALIRAGVIDKAPTSKRALAAVQEAFNTWHEESGAPLAHISRTLGYSIDAAHQ